MRLLSRWKIAAATASLVVCSQAKAETLGDAVMFALSTNPVARAQQEALKARQEDVVQARAAFGPTVQAEAGGLYGGADVEREHLAGTTWSANVSINQSLYTGGLNHARLSQATANAAAAQATLDQSLISLIQQVVTAYAGVTRDQAFAAIAERNVAALAEQLDSVQARYDLREATATDLAQAQARLAGARGQVASAYAQLSSSRSNYLAVVGREPEQLSATPVLDGLPQSLNEAVDVGRRKAPSVRSAIFREVAARAAVEEARAAGRSTVSLRAVAGQAPIATYDPRFIESDAQLQLNVSRPLFTSGLTTSRVRQAASQDEQAKLQVESADRDAVRAIVQAWNSVGAGRAAAAASSVQVQADEAAFVGVREEQRLGLRTELDVLNAQSELDAARRSLTQARYDELSGEVALLSAMGALSIDNVDPIHAPAAPLPKRRRDLVPWVGALDWVDGFGRPKDVPFQPARLPVQDSVSPSADAGNKSGRSQ